MKSASKVSLPLLCCRTAISDTSAPKIISEFDIVLWESGPVADSRPNGGKGAFESSAYIPFICHFESARCLYYSLISLNSV